MSIPAYTRFVHNNVDLCLLNEWQIHRIKAMLTVVLFSLVYFKMFHFQNVDHLVFSFMIAHIIYLIKYLHFYLILKPTRKA